MVYRNYGAFIAAKVLAFDQNRPTPAHRFNDGRDYVPTNKFVVFGHHFAAISGAGPLIGPVLAAQYGFAPGFVWILAGAVLAGAVHDLVILFASVRNDGKSLAEIARNEIGPVAKVTASLATFLIIILALAGLAISVVNALKNNSWGTFALGFTIPVALFIGLYMHCLRPGKVKEASIIGVALVILGVVFLGPMVKGSSIASWFLFNEEQIKLLLPIYGFIASALPVWMLLCPRDYLSSFMKIGTIFLLAIGVICVAPVIRMPSVTSFIHGGGPIVNGPVWPFVFITIACGAVSGFHSLIASGTTPKMISSEKDMLIIGYGAMLMEGFIAIMALIAACVLLPGDYFAINTSAAVFNKIAASGNSLFHITNLPQLSQMVQMDLAGRPGGAVSLAVGMSYILSSIPGLKGLMAYLYQFCILFEALFIMTTIDTGTRVARYILQDALGTIYTPLKRVSWLPGNLFCSAFVTIFWGYLLYGGSIATIWPIFGISNQLLGTTALAIGTSVILRRTKKLKYGFITAIPMLFLGITTVAAGIMALKDTYIPQGLYLNTALLTLAIILVVVIVIDSVRSWVNALNSATPIYIDPS